jgi:hypothetical protein
MKNKILKKKYIVYFLITAFVMFTLPQTIGYATPPHSSDDGYGNLRGFIYKEDGKTPIWGAQVLLENVKTNKVHESNVTDSTGDFKLTKIPVGDYSIAILARDKPYKLKKVDYLVKIIKDKTSTVSFSLKKSINPPFFLLPCGIASIIAGTAASIAVGTDLFVPTPPPVASPVVL